MQHHCCPSHKGPSAGAMGWPGTWVPSDERDTRDKTAELILCLLPVARTSAHHELAGARAVAPFLEPSVLGARGLPVWGGGAGRSGPDPTGTLFEVLPALVLLCGQVDPRQE